MPVDDPRLGSCMSGGQVSTGPLVPVRRISLEHPAYSTSPKSSRHLIRPQQEKQGKPKSRRPAQAGLSRQPPPCFPDSCRGSDPAQCPHHRPHPTPVGEVSFGEKAGAALISFHEIRMDLFNSILPALLSPNAQ